MSESGVEASQDVTAKPSLPKGVRIEVKNLGGVSLDHDEAVGFVREQLEGIRERLLQFPSQEQGLNMSRVHAYREKRGIPRKEIRILSPEDFAQALKIAGEEPGHENGRYLPIHDMAFVKRDLDIEALNGGAEFTESLVVHEMAHTDEENRAVRVEVTPKKRKIRRDNVDFEVMTERFGFVEEDDEEVGNFQEEGYAEFERGRYIVEELGKPDGFVGRFDPEEPNRIDKHSYCGRDKTGAVVKGAMTSGLAAILFELINDHDPEFASVLHRARHSETARMELIQRMNVISPDLYEESRRIDIQTSQGLSEAGALYKKVKQILEPRNTDQHSQSNAKEGEI